MRSDNRGDNKFEEICRRAAMTRNDTALAAAASRGARSKVETKAVNIPILQRGVAQLEGPPQVPEPKACYPGKSPSSFAFTNSPAFLGS